MRRVRHIITLIVKTLCVVVAACLLLSYLSAYISPGTWWISGFLGLFMPVLAAITFLIGVFWLIMRRKIAWFFFIALLPSLFYIPAFVQFGHKEKEISETAVKVLTYNVHMFLTEGKKSLRQVAEFISRENPDIVCLQELYGKDTAEIRKAFKQYPYHYTHYNGLRSNLFFGMGIFSRYPISGRGKILFAGTGNMCSYADIMIDGKPLRIYNNHLESTRLNLQRSLLRVAQEDSRNEEIKEVSMRLKTAFIKRAEQVDAVSAHVATSPFPVLLCGDFNDTPMSYTYRKMKGKMRDAFKEAGHGLAFTFNSGAILRIDYIFNDKQMKVRDFRTAQEIKFSDHYPVLAIFDMY